MSPFHLFACYLRKFAIANLHNSFPNCRFSVLSPFFPSCLSLLWLHSEFFVDEVNVVSNVLGEIVRTVCLSSGSLKCCMLVSRYSRGRVRNVLNLTQAVSHLSSSVQILSDRCKLTWQVHSLVNKTFPLKKAFWKSLTSILCHAKDNTTILVACTKFFTKRQNSVPH